MLKINISQTGKGFFRDKDLYDTERGRSYKVSFLGIKLFERTSDYKLDLKDEGSSKVGFKNKD